ncbi:MAG: lysophospholipid acyltransferase family protein [Eubacteriales bacterium]|nr:lysophospholipid acyltransferase family protein [Eubacteriales bacterium]
MRRIVMMVLRNLLTVPWMAIQLLLYARDDDQHTEWERYALLRKICRRAIRGGNIELLTSGQENIPKEDGFILYPNHQGMFDVLAVIDTCDHPLSVVMKKEVADVPFVKQVRKIMGAQAMDREDVRQSLGVIMQVTKEVAAGRNYLIFPEGTRSKLGNQLLDFKGGSFKAATKAKCPIVPVALIDSYYPFDSHSLKQVTVQVHYLEPITYEEYKDKKTTEIAEIVKKRIEEKIKKVVDK